jgi:hypothetical protein
LKSFRSLAVVLAVFMSLSVVPFVHADSVEFDYNNTFSGTSPGGSAPWLTATFTDVSVNTVSLTLSGAGLVGTEFVKGWYFNVAGVSPSSLTFTAGPQTGTFTDPSISKATDSYKADGSGKYDILFSFATANSQRFISGDSITYTITGIGLDALDFDALCTASAGMGPFFSAVQICAIPSNGQSGWNNPTTAIVHKNQSVPDVATTILLLGMGMLIVEIGRRKLPAFQRL